MSPADRFLSAGRFFCAPKDMPHAPSDDGDGIFLFKFARDGRNVLVILASCKAGKKRV